ncbi:MAG: hypothetical protein AB8H79_20790 [Myxococcota bacterium]
MTRMLLTFALLGLATPAFATGEDDLDDIPVASKKKSTSDDTADLPKRSGPKASGDEPVEEFDLFSDDVEEAEPPELLGGPSLDMEDEEEMDFPVDERSAAPDDDVDILGDVAEEPDDDFMPDFTADTPRKKASRPAPKGPGAVALDVAGKEPLADNYPVSVVAVDRDAVVIELPILIGKSRVGFDSDFALGGDVYVGDTKVSGVRIDVTEASLAEFGPTFVFLKVLAPVIEKEGQVTVKVTKDGKALFARSTPYMLP